VTMCLELLAALLNPEIALNHSLPRSRRYAEDVPPLNDLTPVVTALLSSLHHLGRWVDDGMSHGS
jgi:hypothetical protein